MSTSTGSIGADTGEEWKTGKRELDATRAVDDMGDDVLTSLRFRRLKRRNDVPG